MGASSPRVGPSYDTLRVVVQPWPSRTNYTVTRLHFEGSQRVDTVVGSGKLPITRDQLRARAKPPAPPMGDMGDEQTLDLDFSA